MLYEQYALKIKKYADIRDAILKFKILILSVLSVILVATAGFLAVNGMITEQISGSEEYVFGETPKFSAKALFSPLSFEYSADGENWSADVPDMPGEYYVRAVSERSFGFKGHSDAYAFTILKKDVTLNIADDKVQWRMLPSVEAEGLLSAHSLAEAQTELENGEIGVTEARVLTDTVKIVNGDGKDVTDGYNFMTSPKSVEVVARILTLKANDVTKVYDAEPIAPNGYTVVSADVPESHRVEVKFAPIELSSVGTAKVTISEVKVFEGDNDVTPAYYITANDGEAEITQREVTVTSEETVKTYDGESLVLPEIKTEGLVSGHVISVDAYEGAIITPADSRPTYVNGVSSIKNADGEDVIGNYKITVRTGALRVNKRTITVSIDSDSFDVDGKRQYDGMPVTLTPAYSGEVEGHTAEFEIIYGGDYITPQRITFKDFARVVGIFDSQGVDVTDCYDVSNSSATLEITKRALTVTVHSASKEYDGTPLDVKVTADGAIDGHEVIYDVNYGDIINYTEKPITDYISKDTVNVVNGELNYTHFYDVTVVNGELRIDKRRIGFVTADVTKIYDGKPIGHGEVSVFAYSDDGQILDAPALLGSNRLYITYVNENAYINAGTYRNLAESSYVVDEYGNEDPNYVIYAPGCTFGTLTIEKRKIDVTLKPIVHEYDGNQVLLDENFPDIEYPDGEMPEGEYFNIWLKDVFIKPQLFTPYDVEYAIVGGDLNNYDVRIDFSKAAVEIRSAKIIIDASDLTVDYRGYNYFAEDLVYMGQEELENVIRANYNLPEGYWLTVSFDNTEGYYLTAGVYNYTLKCIVYDNNYRDVTENYEIIINYTNDGYSVMTVNKLKLTFTANDFTKTYDANPVRFWECVDQEGDIAIRDRMSVNLSGEFINAGTYKYSVVYSILSDLGNDALENYDITVIYTNPEAEISLITIEKVKITFTANDYTNVYGAYVVDKWMVLDIEGNVVGADNIIFELVDWETNLPFVAKNAGRYEYALTITITNANGEDGSQNYDVTVLYTNVEKQYSVIEITKVPVIIEAVDTSTEYNGYEQTPSWWWWGKGPWPFVPSNNHEVICVEKYVNVGEYDAKVIFKAYDREGQLVTDNYDVTIIYNGDEKAESCKLTITPRKIFVISADDSKEYDGTPLYNTDTTVYHVYENWSTVETDEFGQRYFCDWWGNEDIIYVYEDGFYYGYYEHYMYYVVENTVHALEDYGLANDHYIKVNSYSSITEYGTTPNALEFVIMSQSEEDIARNYEIVYTQYGTLEIFKRNITVTTQSTYKAYDGKELSDPTASGDRLVNGHSISAVDDTWTVIGPDVQRADNVMEVVILDADGKDVSYNYETSYSYGFLEINKRIISAYTQGGSKEYDGTPLTNPDYTLDIDYVTDTQGLLEGHTCESFLFTTGSQTEVGQCYNRLDGYIVVYDENGNDITHNYQWSLSTVGTLYVTAKKITVTVYNVSTTYDGNAHYSERGKITGGSLNEGDKLLYVRGTARTDVGKSDSVPEIMVIKTKYGYLVIENMDMDNVNNYISNNYVRVTNDNDMFVKLKFSDAYIKITADDKVSVYTGAVSDVNCKQVDRIHEDGSSIETRVYSFSAGEKKTVEVKKRKIVISCDSATASYSTTKYLTAGYRIAEGELIDGHYISAITTGQINYIGSVENGMNLDDIRIYADKDLQVDITQEVKENYDFEILKGTLTLQ